MVLQTNPAKRPKIKTKKPVKPAKTAKTEAAAQKSLSALEKQYPAVQLATLVDAPPEGEQWLHEIKFDGPLKS